MTTVWFAEVAGMKFDWPWMTAVDFDEVANICPCTQALAGASWLPAGIRLWAPKLPTYILRQKQKNVIVAIK